MSPTLKSQLSHSVAKARKDDGDTKGAVSAFLTGMLAGQAAAAAASAANPEPDWDSFVMSEPEITFPADDDTEEEERSQRPDEPLTEREQITASHFEEYDTDRTWGREDD